MKPGYPNQAQKEVKWLIEQSGVTGTLSRPQTSGGGSFFGSNEDSELTVGDIPLEMKDLPPKDLTELGADAVACVLPDSGVQEQDFLAIGETRNRVTEVKLHNFYGTVTHFELHLERERRDG